MAETICIIFSVSRDLHKRIRIERRTTDVHTEIQRTLQMESVTSSAMPANRLTIIIIMPPTLHVVGKSYNETQRDRVIAEHLSRANQHDQSLLVLIIMLLGVGGGALDSSLVMACHPNPIKL